MDAYSLLMVKWGLKDIEAGKAPQEVIKAVRGAGYTDVADEIEKHCAVFADRIKMREEVALLIKNKLFHEVVEMLNTGRITQEMAQMYCDEWNRGLFRSFLAIINSSGMLQLKPFRG